MNTMTEWNAPAPGPWQQDSAHMPVSQTRMMSELYPEGFNTGFTETFARYGLLLDRLAMASVNGFTYHQPQPFDMPGPNGPPTPEQLGAEIERRMGVAAQAFATKQWRQDLALWDEECKPASIARTQELNRMDPSELDDAALAAHLDELAEFVTAMVYQHHRFNVAALLPVGDLAVQAAGWLQMPPPAVLGVLDGYSPVSNVVSDEMGDALEAIRTDDDAQALLATAGDPGERLAKLRASLPVVDDYVAMVESRTIDGFDVVNLTLREQPELILGKLSAALETHDDDPRAAADALASSLRENVPEEHRSAFDELVEEARVVYRLRDERGLYSDIAAVGLVRRAVLEIGRRLADAGRLHRAEDALDATTVELKEMLLGSGPSADEIAEHAERRRRLTAEGAPRFLGDPPPPPPPVDELPPPLARVMSAVGFAIDSVLGQMEEAAGDATTIVGIGVTANTVEGRARIINDVEDLLDVEEGDIIVAAATGESFNSVLHLVGGIVTDHGSHLCHAAIVAREMGFPAVVGTVDGTERIPDGARVRVDGATGEISVLA